MIKLEPNTMTTDQINNTINANQHNPKVVTDDICDGFHTFGQLYFQRMMLFTTLVNLFPELSWKTKRHEDGEKCFGSDDWFLVTIETPAGAYGYHYEMKYWDMFKCDELDKAKHWDGYTEENVDRLLSLTAYASLISFVNKRFNSHSKCPSCIHESKEPMVNSDPSPCKYCKTLHKESCCGCKAYSEWSKRRKLYD